MNRSRSEHFRSVPKDSKLGSSKSHGNLISKADQKADEELARLRKRVLELEAQAAPEPEPGASGQVSAQHSTSYPAPAYSPGVRSSTIRARLGEPSAATPLREKRSLNGNTDGPPRFRSTSRRSRSSESSDSEGSDNGRGGCGCRGGGGGGVTAVTPLKATAGPAAEAARAAAQTAAKAVAGEGKGKPVPSPQKPLWLADARSSPLYHDDDVHADHRRSSMASVISVQSVDAGVNGFEQIEYETSKLGRGVPMDAIEEAAGPYEGHCYDGSGSESSANENESSDSDMADSEMMDSEDESDMEELELAQQREQERRHQQRQERQEQRRRQQEQQEETLHPPGATPGYLSHAALQAAGLSGATARSPPPLVDPSIPDPDTVPAPLHKLCKVLRTPAVKKSVVLVTCGAYNPIHLMHIRAFYLTRQFFEKHTDYRVVCGLMSPAHQDCVRTKTRRTPNQIIAAKHRLEMCRCAVKGSSWLDVDRWEITRRRAMDYLSVLQHVRHLLSKRFPGHPFRIVYVCRGNHLVQLSPQAMRDAGFGCVALCRPGQTDALMKQISSQWTGVAHLVEDSAILSRELEGSSSERVREEMVRTVRGEAAQDQVPLRQRVGHNVAQYMARQKIAEKMAGGRSGFSWDSADRKWGAGDQAYSDATANDCWEGGGPRSSASTPSKEDPRERDGDRDRDRDRDRGNRDPPTPSRQPSTAKMTRVKF
jgi:hypothetical protein